jgi:hypothetical protein
LVFLLTSLNLRLILRLIKVTKAVVMDQVLAEQIQELADRDRRSFARESQILLEEAVNHRQPAMAEAEEERG